MRAGINAGIGSRRLVGGGSPPVAPFQTLATDGFTGSASDPDAAVGQSFTVTRNGYDASANAITFSDTLSVTSRMRTVWNVGWTSAGTVPVNDVAKVALSDYVYQGEFVSGVTNSSTVVSPTPIAAWVSIERQLIGNTATLEVVAGHRDARSALPVACVTGTITDGTNTVTAISATPVISSYAADVQPLWVYELMFDTTSLISDVLLTANAKVYPHVGVAASVADSSLSSDRRGFSPRYYIKNVSRLASPPIAYVSTTGTAAGTWSTTAATAEAAPFDTLENARLQIAVQTAATGGYVDGCEIRLMAGTHSGVMGTTATNSTCKVASLVITRDPNASRATSIISMAANCRPRLSLGSLMPVASGALLLRDITITRTAGSWQGEAASLLETRFDQCNINNSANTGWLSSAFDYWYGCTMTTSLGASTWLSQNGATNMHRMWRGVTCLNARLSNINMYYNFSSLWYNTGKLGSTVAGSQSGTMRVNNKYMNINYTSGGYEPFGETSSESLTGAYIAGNCYEPIPATASYTGFGASADEPQAGNVVHMVIHNNTILGAAASFRCNDFYDTTAGVFRVHTLNSSKGNIMPQLNTKGDWFYAVNLGNPAGEAPNHIGNWAYFYGVGCSGNYVMYVDAGGTGPGIGASITQASMGINGTMGTSATAKINPLITTYAAVDYVAGVLTAGAGGSVFTLQGGSPCKNKLPYAVMPFDLAGTARSASGTDSTGAFV